MHLDVQNDHSGNTVETGGEEGKAGQECLVRRNTGIRIPVRVQGKASGHGEMVPQLRASPE